MDLVSVRHADMKEPATYRPPVPRPAMPWVFAGIVVLALSLRAPIIAPTAVVGAIQADTGLSATGAGLLTGIPVLLFAIATPLATLTIRHFGAEATAILCLAGVLAGTILRSAGPAPAVLAGSVLIGTAMALGNIVVPVIIRRDVPWRQCAAATGAFSAAMNVGSMAVLLGTPPLAELVGWRWAIASWGIVTAAGLAYWLLRGKPRLRAGTWPESPKGLRVTASAAPHATGTSDGPGALAATEYAAKELAHSRRIVALLVVAFCGAAGAYYATTAWLPLLLFETHGLGPTASGATASLFQVAAIVGAFGVPLLAAQSKIWVPVAVIAACWIALPTGLLAAPGAYVLWSIVGGIAQGGGFTAVFSIVARIVHSDAVTASASARIQGGGYLAATAAPPLAGWLHAATGDWIAPLFLVLTATLLFTVSGLLAAWLSERR